MILFCFLTFGCSKFDFSAKEKILNEHFVENALEDDFSFLDSLEYSDLDRLIKEEYDGDTLLDIIAIWDKKDVISKFVQAIIGASSGDEDKKREIFIKCLKVAFLYKSINFIKASFEALGSISNEEFKLLLKTCFKVEKGKKKIYFDYHAVEADIYESLEYLFEENRGRSEFLENDMVEKIFCLEYWDSENMKGPFDLILSYKGEDYLKKEWLDNDKLAKLIVDNRLVMLARNLIEIYKNAKIDVSQVFEYAPLTDYLGRIGMKWKKHEVSSV
tara:strand:- start:1521 stop:2339 length:819 start_codon:yes stop_codon:yes gene_type:complete